MRNISLAGAALILAAGAAWAQPRTVNDYSPAEQARAEAAARAAGFTPGAVAMAQAGYLFLKAEKDGKRYFLTVSPQGEVFPSTPMMPPGNS